MTQSYWKNTKSNHHLKRLKLNDTKRIEYKTEENEENKLEKIEIEINLINNFNRGKTIHPTENFISLSLFKIHSWAEMFLTSDLMDPVMEAARGQKHPSEAENDMKESIY